MTAFCCTLDARVREASLSVDIRAESLYLKIYSQKSDGTLLNRTLNLQHQDNKTIVLDQACAHFVCLVLRSSYELYDPSRSFFGSIRIPKLDSRQTFLSVQVDSPENDTTVTITRDFVIADR